MDKLELRRQSRECFNALSVIHTILEESERGMDVKGGRVGKERGRRIEKRESKRKKRMHERKF